MRPFAFPNVIPDPDKLASSVLVKDRICPDCRNCGNVSLDSGAGNVPCPICKLGWHVNGSHGFWKHPRTWPDQGYVWDRGRTLKTIHCAGCKSDYLRGVTHRCPAFHDTAHPRDMVAVVKRKTALPMKGAV